jgi:hypothetical protein
LRPGRHDARLRFRVRCVPEPVALGRLEVPDRLKRPRRLHATREDLGELHRDWALQRHDYSCLPHGNDMTYQVTSQGTFDYMTCQVWRSRKF